MGYWNERIVRAMGEQKVGQGSLCVIYQVSRRHCFPQVELCVLLGLDNDFFKESLDCRCVERPLAFKILKELLGKTEKGLTITHTQAETNAQETT
jgi:hypothetical protein